MPSGTLTFHPLFQAQYVARKLTPRSDLTSSLAYDDEVMILSAVVVLVYAVGVSPNPSNIGIYVFAANVLASSTFSNRQLV